MLSGEIPFLRHQHSLSSEVISKIKACDLCFDQDVWKSVSLEAQDLVKRMWPLWCIAQLTKSFFYIGLLTVDPKNRISISEVVQYPWVQGSSTPSTPLKSPGISIDPYYISTFKVLNKVARGNFQLAEVNNAPLAKRRKKKWKLTDSTESRSSSNESGNLDVNQTQTELKHKTKETDHISSNSDKNNYVAISLEQNSDESVFDSGYSNF